GISVDGMPVNMRTHAHGQGYADLNFLIPELVDRLLARKGPYWASEGDFSSAGAVHLTYADRLEKNLIAATGGSFGYWRGLAAGTMQLGGGALTGAAEIERYNGPWDVPDGTAKYNGVLRYSQGTADNGFSITGMAYTNRWHATNHIASRAVDQGLIGRFGTLDPSDAGDSQRYSLSGRWSRKDERSADRVEAYFVASTLNLFNNFTYYMDDPVNGDQFQQSDKRKMYGLNASHTTFHQLAGRATENVVGFQLRHDSIDLGLFNTVQRMPTNTIRTDHVEETSASLYLEEKVTWTDWLRSTAGLRGDLFWTGDTTAFLPQPKAGLVFGPFARTEFYVNAGLGYHSNDVRGLAQGAPLLVSSRGAEVGVRTQAVRGLDSSVALFLLDFDSELVFAGDSGDTSPAPASRRIGVEWTNRWRPLAWLALDGDLAYTQARFRDGTFIPSAPALVASAGATVGEETGWFGALRWRYFGARPLTPDGSVASGATSLVNARAGYTFESGVKVTLDALNVLNTQADQVTYYYESQLRGEPAPVADTHFHPVEPLAFRLTVAKAF
ncbi:MAG: TonB-dependent receptor, partial [Proteobacteria bacterium]|nr:TonB-dependent receptor [Pseudomonadota bacterium]